MRTPQWLRYPADLFATRVDERVYALVRIAFAIVALLNLISLWPDREVFFSDVGLVDPSVAFHQASPVYLSVFRFAGSPAAVTGFMLLTALALVLLMLGVWPRMAAAWVLIWHISYLARSPLFLAGWDVILRCFAFLILISPLGICWTLPGLRGGGASRGRPANVSSHGLILMRLQVFVIYWQAVLLRLMVPDPYWRNGQFLNYFMLSHYARWPGAWVLEYSDLLVLGTYAVMLAEIAIPVLLWREKTRWWGALLGAALHLGISIFSRGLGLFGVAMMMTYVAFLRTEDVEALGRWLRRRGKRAPEIAAG